MESTQYIFNTEAMKKLLANKSVVFIGDSGKLRYNTLPLTNIIVGWQNVQFSFTSFLTRLVCRFLVCVYYESTLCACTKLALFINDYIYIYVT